MSASELGAGKPELILEAGHVDLVGRERAEVAGTAGHQDIGQPAGAQGRPHPGNVTLQGLERGAGLILTPQRVEHLVGEHHHPGPQRERADQCTLPGAEHRPATWARDLHRPE